MRGERRIRYTNFFPDINIFNTINLDIKLNNNCIGNKKTIIRTEIEQNGFNSLLQIFNYVSLNKPNEKKLSGSIIDIDTVANGKIKDFFTNYKEIITRGHNYEKDLFFSLLKEEFLKELNLPIRRQDELLPYPYSISRGKLYQLIEDGEYWRLKITRL